MTDVAGIPLLDTSAWGDAGRWDQEYSQIQSIPSSHRLRPSHAFRSLERFIPVRPGASVLDAGAGTGRHSLYLAAAGSEVHAVDASSAACTVLQERLSTRPELSGSVRVEEAPLDLDDVPDETYDIILDSYVSCHLLGNAQRLRYLESLIRRLRPGGVLYTACMGADDAYYREQLVTGTESQPVAVDPLNGISKLLQSRDAFGELLGQLAPVLATTTETFDDIVAGTPYYRQVLAAVLQRPY